MANRILSPLHFEDMEPHRFEDLARNLLYDFRNWQTIEATGRGGGDDGFDVRAWEKTAQISNQETENEDEENIEGIHLMEGNLWMIQCKREKQLGPTRVAEIINETVIGPDIPYGYILVAPVNFSKKSYDAFRDALRAKGVMEFYIWGKAEIEDMLFLPKNDRILFAFMGVSLVSNRRSVASKVKFSINNKNKLLRVLSGGQNNTFINESILLRNINDENYPEIVDEKEKPSWIECKAWGLDPNGLLLRVHERFGYIDPVSKAVDYFENIDLLHRESDFSEDEDFRRNRFELEKKFRDHWEHLPSKNQFILGIDALIQYEDILLIDEKGDGLHNFPHIFIEPDVNGDLLRKDRTLYFRGSDRNEPMSKFLGRSLERIKVLPSDVSMPQKGHYYHDRELEIDEKTRRTLGMYENKSTVLVDHEGKFDFLQIRDCIKVKQPEKSDELFVRVTHKYKITLKDYLVEHPREAKEQIENLFGRKLRASEKLSILELRNLSKYQLTEYADEELSSQW